MFKRILVPIDDSKTSNLALKMGISLVKDQKAKLRIIHTVDYFGLTVGVEGIDATLLSEGIKKSALKLLDKANAMAKRSKVKPETKLIEYYDMKDQIAKRILQDAKRWKADLIIIGTHGRQGFQRIMFGSVAESVVRSGKIPVLLVRGKS